MNRNIFAIASWFLTAIFIFALDAVIRRQDPAFYEPRSDYTTNASKGLFEIFDIHAFWLFPIILVLPMIIILQKENRKSAIIMPLIFFVLSAVAMPFVYVIYSCATGVACF